MDEASAVEMYRFRSSPHEVSVRLLETGAINFRAPMIFQAVWLTWLALRIRLRSRHDHLVVIAGSPCSGRSALLKHLVGRRNVVSKSVEAARTGACQPIHPETDLGTRPRVGIDESHCIDADHLKVALGALIEMHRQLFIVAQDYSFALSHILPVADRARPVRVLIVQLSASLNETQMFHRTRSSGKPTQCRADMLF